MSEMQLGDSKNQRLSDVEFYKCNWLSLHYSNIHIYQLLLIKLLLAKQ